MLELEKRLSWVYLINLVFYIAPFFYINYSLVQYVWMTLALAAFIGCYYWIYRSHTSQMLWPILLMALIASAITPMNYGSISMFAYVSFFIGFAYNFRQFLAGVTALICVLVLLDHFFVKGAPYFLLYGSALVLAIGVFGVLDRARRASLLKEQRSAEEIKQLATIVERERIARDLHDIMGHSLSGIVLKADLADKLLQQQQVQAASQQLKELASIARESLSQVRQTVSGYKHKGLSGELQNLTSKLREAGLKVNGKKSFFAKHELEYLGYMITREGIKPMPQKVEAILKIATPSNRKELRGFIGTPRLDVLCQVTLGDCVRKRNGAAQGLGDGANDQVPEHQGECNADEQRGDQAKGHALIKRL